MVPVGFGRGSPGVQRLRQPSPSSHAFLSLVSDACCVLDQQERVRVLVVDDEPSIVDVISIALRHHGFGVEAADSGREALDWVRKWRPHVMVLDVMLPDMQGFEVARRLSAEHAAVPILFLSAQDTTADKVRGLTTGGDDYVTKPFSLEELIARLRIILRRTGAFADDCPRLTFADLELDEDTREISRAGRPIELTATEFRLLRYLMLNPRRVLTRAQLLDHVWSYDFGGDARVLETYISYLRRKIDVDGLPLLHTVRGIGYVLRLPRG
jgi:two-component system OmpR family response regulator